jgi:hypothetical protein
MSETPEAPVEKNETPELTKPVDFIVPNQDLFEQVIDQRLAAHSAHEETSSKSTTTRSRTTAKAGDKS